MSVSESLEWRLARIAHEVWCERMVAEGWRPGAAFDGELRTHDAIVPFDQLCPVDRRSAYLGIVATECANDIRRSINYTRGQDRELGVKDMFVGLRVVYSESPKIRGAVLSWKEDLECPGTLTTISVKWDSGETIEYAAAEREIVPEPIRG